MFPSKRKITWTYLWTKGPSDALENASDPIPSTGRTVYLPTWMLDFYGFQVNIKYMEQMWDQIETNPQNKTSQIWRSDNLSFEGKVRCDFFRVVKVYLSSQRLVAVRNPLFCKKLKPFFWPNGTIISPT